MASEREDLRPREIETRRWSARRFEPDGLHLFDETPRVAERGRMAAVELVGFDTQPVSDHAAQPRSREESIVATEHEARCTMCQYQLTSPAPWIRT